MLHATFSAWHIQHCLQKGIIFILFRINGTKIEVLHLLNFLVDLQLAESNLAEALTISNVSKKANPLNGSWLLY